MANKNINSNYTLEQYNKKYKNRKHELLKVNKKEVIDFDKRNITKAGYLLRGHKWALIGDTYYEIPKPMTLTWFRNLHISIQACTCILLCGAVATSIALPIYFSNLSEYISVNSDVKQYCDIVSNKINDNGDRELLLQAKGERVEFKKIDVRIGNDLLQTNKEYEFNLITSNGDNQKYNLIIYKNALASHQGNIYIKPILKGRLKITNGDLNLTLGKDTVQLKVIDENTGKDLTDSVGYLTSAPFGETCGIEVDDEGCLSTIRVGLGIVKVFASSKDYVPYTINVKVEADPTKGNKTLTLESGEGGSAYGGGTYPYYTLATISSNPLTSYRFVKWVDKNGQYVSDKEYYQFRLSEDMYLKAIFEHNLDYFKSVYNEYFKSFDESSACPYSSCVYTDLLTGEKKSCTLNYDSLATPKKCEATPEGMNAITVAGGQYTYNSFISELEALKSQPGYIFNCSVEGSKKNLLLTVINPDGTCYGFYKFNSDGYLLQYAKTTANTNENIYYSISYTKK